MENYFDNVKLGQVLVKWKLHLLIITVVAGIVGFAGSFLLETRYKSTALFYPSNIAPYSDESETEQMLQWLQAQDIRDSLITIFKLDKHYELDSNYKYFKSSMEWELSERIKIKKTEYEAIEIQVLDKDPQIAYEMVNKIMDLVTKKIRRIHKMKFDEVLVNAKYIMKKNDQEIKQLELDLQSISQQYGILNYEAQTEAVSKGLIGGVDGSAGRIVNNSKIKKLEKNLKDHGAQFYTNYSKILPLMEARESLYNILNIAVMDANRNYTYINMISEPYVADKKASPKRLFVAFYTIIASLLLALISIMIIEGIKNKQTA